MSGKPPDRISAQGLSTPGDSSCRAIEPAHFAPGLASLCSEEFRMANYGVHHRRNGTARSGPNIWAVTYSVMSATTICNRARAHSLATSAPGLAPHLRRDSLATSAPGLASYICAGTRPTSASRPTPSHSLLWPNGAEGWDSPAAAADRIGGGLCEGEHVRERFCEGARALPAAAGTVCGRWGAGFRQ